MKRIIGLTVIGLISSWVALVSAAPKQIDIEPEECETRCFFLMGVPIICYDICY